MSTTFIAVLEREAHSGYSVSCPAIPGCVSQGESLDEALANIREAIALYFEEVEEPTVPHGGAVEDIAV